MITEKFPGIIPKHFILYANSKEQGIDVNGYEWFCPVIEKPDKELSILYRNGIFVFEFPDKDGCRTYADTIENYGRDVLREAIHTALQAVVDEIPEQYFTGDKIVTGVCYPSGDVMCMTKQDFIITEPGRSASEKYETPMDGDNNCKQG